MNLLELQVLLVVSGVPEGSGAGSLLDWAHAVRSAHTVAPGVPMPSIARAISRLAAAGDPQYSPRA
jgi:hypothetical protein